ncbi:hypothetical protein [Pseudalkalibacillus decolorationis]|uniref:hypothetical protein n=1 Tax=Pseudalkalibacillus decolorationis TaxID=163879 RepID=UPI0021497676|nr:hypothetical protein [Pseudalkalibacillus decolorationis]
MKKHYVYILLVGLFLFNVTDVEAKQPSEAIVIECTKFNSAVLLDIKRSFPELNVLDDEKEKVLDYTLRDLQKAKIAVGKNDRHINSLLRYFEGGSIGERRLFILGGQPSEKYESNIAGYLLYKEIDGTNVFVKLRLTKDKWVREYKKEKKGRVLSYQDYCK